MKTVILETEHFEGAYPVIRLFDTPGNEIVVYTTASTYKRFADLFGEDTNRYKWTILPDGRMRFFYSLFKHLKKDKPDIVYLNTIGDNHLLYELTLRRLPLKRIILTVHDINCLFKSRFEINFRKLVIHIGKKRLLRLADEYNVVGKSMIGYLQALAGNKPVHNIPGAIYEERQSIQQALAPLRIVIPGSLDKKRRDYKQAFDLAALADKQNISLDIILLGGNAGEYGKEIIQRAKEFYSPHCKIITYNTSIVDQHEFDAQLDLAHFIFIPSVINTKICGDIPEVYGKTKSSGNLFDIVKHAKPFIVPAELAIDDYLQPACFRYSALKDIVSFLSAILTDEAAYAMLQEKAVIASHEYTIQKIRERNADVFLNP